MDDDDTTTQLDDDRSLNDDYLDDSVQEVERTFPDDAPEDAPAGGIDQLRQSVRDDMPGDDAQAMLREATSPNERQNQFEPRNFDVEENTAADFTSPDSESVADKQAREETAGDPPADDEHLDHRVG